METSYLKARPFGNRSLSGCPISTQTVARIETCVLGDPKAAKAQAAEIITLTLHHLHQG